jgi:hypothetical protein
MSSSKIILVGAISVVFGLYSLSLLRVESVVGHTVEDNSYIQRADLMARAGIQRALHRWTTGNFEASVGPVYVGDTSYSINFFSYYSYTASVGPGMYDLTWLNAHKGYPYVLLQLTIVAHGFYKGPGEPDAFTGHEVIRTAYATFINQDIAPVGNPDPHWYDIKLYWVRDSVNYIAERQLDNLQQFKNF